MSSSRPIRRRTVLAGSAGLLTGLAGCSTDLPPLPEPETSHPPPLRRIVLWNYYGTAIRISLVVKRNGNIVHWDTHEVGPPDDGGRRHGLPLAEEWMGCGLYVVSARLQNKSRWATVDFREVEPTEVENGKIEAIDIEFEFRPTEVTVHPFHYNAPSYRCKGKTTETRGTQN
jgi:hypothetical protein